MKNLVIVLAAVLAAYSCAPLILGDDAAAMLFGPLAREYVRDQVPALAAHVTWNWTHRLGGFALLLAGLRQLRSFARWHRVIGRLYVALAAVMSLGGAWMACVSPFSPDETLPALLFAGLLLGFTALGVVAIRSGRTAEHIRWISRSYAVALGPLFVRIVHVLLTNVGMMEREAMAPAFWIGWVLPLLILETKK